MLNALSICLDNRKSVGERRAARSMERQGFWRVVRVEWEGGGLSAWGHAEQDEAEDCLIRTPSGTACCIGPLWYRGHFGRQALTSLLEDVHANGHLDEDDLRGNFALFLKTSEHVWLLNDALGFVRIFASADGCFFSTSWLATSAYLDNVEIHAASAIEYVLLGAAHSDCSVVQGVGLLPFGHGWDLKRRQTWQRRNYASVGKATRFDSLGEAVEIIGTHLRTVSREVATAFPCKVNMALSGGFDSRLILAGMLAAGVQPRLFVYGESDSADVTIANAVAAANGLSIDAIDKGKLNKDLPMPDMDALVRSALFFDGLSTDGIDDPGADRRTRMQQTAQGCIALNGGGGEIFRNFFHLPDCAFTARNIVRSFYCGFDRQAMREPGGQAQYETRIAASMISVMGATVDNEKRLTRDQVELLYPLFRCHYWMGVNNSVAVRHGYYMTPLVDFNFVRMAQRLPLRWKNAGVFQSRLIAAMHTAIASQPSAYGFSFDAGPDVRARFTEWSTCARPVWMRPLINATRRRLGRDRVSSELLRRYRALLPGEWLMDPLLDLTKLPDTGALGRALAVEVVWRKIF